MRCMNKVLSNKFNCVLDKGTLDAIASGGDDKKDSDVVRSCFTINMLYNIQKWDVQSTDAAKYMSEVWRVLKTKGIFIVITTMPPDIFKSIAIDPINSSHQELSKGSSTDWGCGSKSIQLQTKEGGVVYYYCVTKLYDVDVSAKDPTIDKCNPTERDQVMQGIMNLLEEAKKAKEFVDQARLKVLKSILSIY